MLLKKTSELNPQNQEPTTLDAIAIKYFKDISVGMTGEFEKQITDKDVRAFAEITGDHNPLHLDEDYAKDSIFGERISHGILVAGHISAVFGFVFPGPGWIYLNQSLQFRAPVKIGALVKTKVEVVACDGGKNIVDFATECAVDGKVVLKGSAKLKSPD